MITSSGLVLAYLQDSLPPRSNILFGRRNRNAVVVDRGAATRRVPQYILYSLAVGTQNLEGLNPKFLHLYQLPIGH